MFVQDHIGLYEQFLHEENSRVDPQRWKLVSEQGACRAYSERRGSIDGSSSSSGDDVPIHADTPRSKLPTVLVTGTVLGDLEDAIYGYVCPTLDQMRVKTSYVNDQLVGAHVLATIVPPTPEDPFRAVTVKWMEKGQRMHVRAVVNNRDFVYMESTGVDYLRNGERVGYQLIHSVQFLETPPLDRYIRGNMSMCACYRQKDPFSTEVFIKGYLNPAGGLMRSIVVHSAAAALLSVSKNVYCAQMKKLAPPKQSIKLLSGKKRRRTCKICFRCVCKECREGRKLCFMLPDHRLVEQDVYFCKRCLNDALSSKAQAVARDEVIMSGEVYEWSNTYGSSSSNEPVLIDDLNDR
ncbi:hypothetical protein PHYSODRAFT_505412 [Phytophthora sojae]|uniref:START domain-containing protein n=1 Tax=Phytophthora sojae (strain P6497) TaxID=1094619 RepID=G4ZLI6_PHYSP|nr:hypothetical protein PHYSODRAFT_505412 [Phytophthora sojae]EGZ14561.1 hypothetical protein PHYSODRAFT_505412 [Phytophthora sojae]|eukprot:XP_009528310.1 hypothetical protein PHYSODRAFT_505412 [Phytophthora sojae]